MSTVQLENLMLLGAILGFGCVPALLDSVGIKFGIPNYILAIIIAALVLMVVVTGTAGSLDAAAAAFLLLGIPGITLTYVVCRLLFWGIGSLFKLAFGRSTSSRG